MKLVWLWISDHLAALVALAVLVSSLLNRSKLKALHVDLNSRLSQLLAVSAARERATGHAEGMVEGRRQEITERTDREELNKNLE